MFPGAPNPPLRGGFGDYLVIGPVQRPISRVRRDLGALWAAGVSTGATLTSPNHPVQVDRLNALHNRSFVRNAFFLHLTLLESE
jgi:hypothetical protein